MTDDVADLFARHERERYAMYARHLDAQMVRVLRAIGYDIGFCRGSGQYLYDRDGVRYLDLLSGFGVFAIGRNHRVVREALKSVLDSELPNLVQMDVSTLAGILAERLLARVPYLDKVFFANSGTESVEAAIKFARAATGRPGIVYCEHAFHGLSYGALSLNGDDVFRSGFEPLLPDCVRVPFNDLLALEKALRSRTMAAFIVEPIQGKGVNLPADGYLEEAVRLCRRAGTLFVVDEVQTGMGRTGRFLATDLERIDADLVLLAKALSGGFVPVGAVTGKRWIFDKTFDRMDRAVVHGSTFGKNNLAMAAGLAVLSVLEDERLIENAARRGETLLRRLQAMVPRYELLREVRGRGMMIALEFGPPRSFALRAAWALLEKATKGLFCQTVVIPLLTRHRILSQVAGHEMYVIKLLPALCLSQEDEDWIVRAFDDVIGECHRVPSALWDLATTLAGNTLRLSGGHP